jgi:hypothetical protein
MEPVRLNSLPPDYAALFAEIVAYRVIEKRAPILESFIREQGLPKSLSIECRPLSWCGPQKCFVNVDQQIERSGGSMMTGWLFEEFENRAIIGVAHGIWISISGRRLDITPHQAAPERIIFSEDKKVALKRGYTLPPKLILSTDPRVIAIERFETLIDKLFEDRFVKFGEYIDIHKSEGIAAALEVGLPPEVAYHLVQLRMGRGPR